MARQIAIASSERPGVDSLGSRIVSLQGEDEGLPRG
jgi:hypothetical protein